jgi:predicted permease
MIGRLELVRQDLTVAARSLARSPLFVVTTVLSLALGIGASAAAFAVLDAVRFRALPFPHGERLVTIQESPIAAGAPAGACLATCDPSYETFAQVLRTHPFHSLDAVVGYTSGGKGLVLGDEIVPVLGGVVSPNAFALLNARPAIGRVLTAEDDRLGAPLAVVLGYGLWTSRFAADPGILGRQVKLSDSRYTVVGVMLPGFEFEAGAQFWLPVVPTLDPSTRPSIRNVTVVGRLAPGATLAMLRGELSTIEPAAVATARGKPATATLIAAPLRDRYVASTQSHDVVFTGVIACVLLIAVANVATLLLVRTLQQERELAVRTALGGGIRHLTSYLLSQQVLLVAAGAMLGIALASWLLRVLASLAVLDSLRPLGMEYRVDGTVVVFAILLAVIIAICLGLVPLKVIRSMNVQRVLRESTTGASAGSSHAIAQRAFVVAETACAAVLLVGATLMAATVLRLSRVDLGFDAARLVQGTPSFPHGWRVKETYLPIERRILVDLAALPGAASAAMRASNRLGSPGAPGEIRLAGESSPLPPSAVPNAAIAVSPGYFATAGVRLVAGRDFDGGDRETSVPVAIVNEWAARRWWPNGNAVGQRLVIDTARGSGLTVTVVGVVRDNKAAQPNVLLAAEGPELYRPFEQAPSAFPSFLVRSTNGLAPEALLRPTRQALIRAVPDRPLFTQLASEQIARQLGGVRTNALQILGFAAIGLVLALIGVHGVLSYTVSRRTREIGIRGALGASRGALRLMVVRDAMVLVLIGLGLGLPAAAIASRYIGELLHGTSVTDLRIYAAVAVIVLAAALVASWIPARRASRVDPMTALRS